MKRRAVFFRETAPSGSFASGCLARALKEFALFAELMAQERLGFILPASLDGREQKAFVLRDVEEELGIVLREVLGRLLEVRYECGGEDLKHAVATGFKKEKVELAVPAVSFGGIAGVCFDAADRVLKAAEQGGRHAADCERDDVHLNELTGLDELADVEVRDVHLNLNLGGEVLGTERIDGHATLGRTVDDAHLGENAQCLAHLVARHVEAGGQFGLRINAFAGLGLAKNVVMNVAKERLFIHGKLILFRHNDSREIRNVKILIILEVF